MGTDCDNALYANLGYYSARPICIGVNGKIPTSTYSAGSTTISTSPAVSGEISGCRQYFNTKSGDTCAGIE